MIDRVGDGKGWLALAHVSPDGDALGSLKAAELLWPDMVVALHDSGPPIIRRLAADMRMFRTNADIASLALSATGVLMLDCSEPQRAGLDDQLVAAIESKVIVIDHHETARPYGMAIRDVNAPSTTAMLFRLARHRMTPDAATWLYYGLLTDTLGFRTAGTTAETFRIAEEMLHAGARHEAAVRYAFQSATLIEILEGARALTECVQIVDEGKALIIADRTMPPSAGYDAMRRVQECADIQCVVLLTEQERDGQWTTRGSIRARSPFRATPFAETYGGGGHAFAAGFSLPMALADAAPIVQAHLLAYSPCELDEARDATTNQRLEARHITR